MLTWQSYWFVQELLEGSLEKLDPEEVIKEESFEGRGRGRGRGGGRGRGRGRGRRREIEMDDWGEDAEGPSLSHWEECTQCSTWVELGTEEAAQEGKACPTCGEQVRK